VFAFDDGGFTFRKGTVAVAGVVVRLPSYLEGAAVTECEIDGLDATQRIAEMVIASRFREQLKAIMLDGIALGGFNVVDLDELRNRTSLPVISVTRRRPDLKAIRRALELHFEDWERRVGLIEKYAPRFLSTKRWHLFVSSSGMGEGEARELIDASVVRGNYPEPLRMAHIFAGAITHGESRGKA